MPIPRVFFIGFNALGDVLCTTPTLRAFRKQHPDIFITYIVQNAAFCRVLEHNPDIDLVLYNEHMFLHGMTQYSSEWFYSLPLDVSEQTHLYHFDMNLVCSKEESFHDHIARGFSKLLDIPIRSVRPIVAITSDEQRIARSFMRGPYVVLCPHSNANPKRADNEDGRKNWPVERWLELAKRIRAHLELDVIALGAEKDPRFNTPMVRSLYGLPIKIVSALLKDAAAVVTLENGLAHLGHAVDAVMVVLYSDIVPKEWAFPEEASRCHVFYGDPYDVPCDEVFSVLTDLLGEEEYTPNSK